LACGALTVAQDPGHGDILDRHAQPLRFSTMLGYRYSILSLPGNRIS
jgi:hypothetical protein